MMGGKRSSVWEGVSSGEVEQGHTEGEEKDTNFVHSPIDIRL